MARKSVAGTGADPVIEFVDLEVDGKVYKLCWDFNAIAKAESAEKDLNLMHGIATVMLNGMNVRELRGLLWGAVSLAQPKMTLEDAGRLIRIDTMPDIREALIRAWNASLPEGKKIVGDPTDGGESAPASSPTAKSGSSATPTPAEPSDSLNASSTL